MRVYLSLFLSAGLLCLISPLMADDYPVILRGKVVMADGSPPPKTVGIQRICSDEAGSAPGPITDKKGEWLWRIPVDPMRTRVCHLEVNLPGYVSNRVDISGLNGYTSTMQTLPDIILTAAAPNPMAIVSNDKEVPGKASSSWKAALKAIDAGTLPEAETQIQAAVKTAPKFALGYHTLGILYSTDQKPKEAKQAWEQALAADPKFFPPYVALARLCIHMKDWQCAANASDSLIKADPKRTYPEIYIHLAAAKYGLKDYDGAKSAVEDAIKYDQIHKRSEYVLGRVLEAKGDIPGAKEHMTKYLQLDPNVADVEMVKKHVEYLGKPEAATIEPEIELP
jgi:tetratricopeptide (TPR) repeat protein